jgi:hypothetical protein
MIVSREQVVRVFDDDHMTATRALVPVIRNPCDDTVTRAQHIKCATVINPPMHAPDLPRYGVNPGAVG